MAAQQRSFAADVARRIIDALAAPILVGDGAVAVGASVGIAYAAAVITDGAGLVDDADTAMYCAKAAGRGRHALFDEGMRTQSRSPI